MGKKKENKVKNIHEKIELILQSNDEFTETIDSNLEFVEVDDQFEVDELYTDIFVLVKNIEDFYSEDAKYKAALLLESFLLESMILMKKNPENIVVESGEFYCKATSFTPTGDEVLSIFEDAVSMNTMIDEYNQALSENGFPVMEVGIGIASFVKTEFEHEEEDECDCDHEDGESCSCGHDHEEDDEYDYGIDYDNTASTLAEIANNGEFDPICLNNIAYELLSTVDEAFFNEHLEEVEFDDDFVIFHGNIVSEE